MDGVQRIGLLAARLMDSVEETAVELEGVVIVAQFRGPDDEGRDRTVEWDSDLTLPHAIGVAEVGAQIMRGEYE